MARLVPRDSGPMCFHAARRTARALQRGPALNEAFARWLSCACAELCERDARWAACERYYSFVEA